MPNTTTAKKNLRKSQKRRVINLNNNSAIRTYKKKVLSTIAELVNTGVGFDAIMQALRGYLGKIHSKSRKNSFEKISAANFESKIVSIIRKKIA